MGKDGLICLVGWTGWLWWLGHNGLVAELFSPYLVDGPTAAWRRSRSGPGYDDEDDLEPSAALWRSCR